MVYVLLYGIQQTNEAPVALLNIVFISLEVILLTQIMMSVPLLIKVSSNLTTISPPYSKTQQRNQIIS